MWPLRCPQKTIVPPPVATLPHVQAFAAEHALQLDKPPPNLQARQCPDGLLALDEHDLQAAACDTTKDKDGNKNATTAGVLAVAWSCGIVLQVTELYGSESLAQVYAALVTLWDRIQYVPPLFFYDDGCHLARWVGTAQALCARRTHPGDLRV
jgi:hypothetical protein